MRQHGVLVFALLPPVRRRIPRSHRMRIARVRMPRCASFIVPRPGNRQLPTHAVAPRGTVENQSGFPGSCSLSNLNQLLLQNLTFAPAKAILAPPMRVVNLEVGTLFCRPDRYYLGLLNRVLYDPFLAPSLPRCPCRWGRSSPPTT
jgi:hypothetical protein